MNGELPGLFTDLLALDLDDTLVDTLVDIMWRAPHCFDRRITIYEARHRNAYVIQVRQHNVVIRRHQDPVDAAKEHHGRKARANIDLRRCI